MSPVWTVLIFLKCIMFSEIQCAKILAAFPTPSISHQFAFRPYIDKLVERGHEVVLLTPYPAFPKGQAPVNLTEIDVHDISHKYWEDLPYTDYGTKGNIIKQLEIFGRHTSMFEKQLHAPELQKILNEDKDTFDLIVIEAWCRSGLGLGHLLKKPIIQISSLGGSCCKFEEYGAPMHPIIFPTFFNQRVYNLSVLEVFWEYFKYILLKYIKMRGYHHDLAVGRRNFGDDMPYFDELYEKYVQLLILNEHQIWAENHPIPPNIIYVGGIHLSSNKTLPTELQEYLDSCNNGVIYVSFGTNVKTETFPPEKIRTMIKALSDLPYNVIWKWHQNILPESSRNIKVSKWLPQAQLLKHPNVKLFITQGGLQSTDETINAAVPVIGIPMMGDQWYNTEKYVHHKIGLQLDINSITEESLRTAVTTVVEDKSYKENIERLRSLMHQHPIKSVDSAVWWTEYILRFGGKHLRSPASNMSWSSYYELPLVFSLLSAVSLLFVILILILCSARRLMLRKMKKIKIY